MVIREETYLKWENKFGPYTRTALNMIYEASEFPKELGRIYLYDVINHFNNNNIFYIDDRNWVLFHFLKKKNKMKLSTILSKDKKGSILLDKLEKKCVDENIPYIILTVVAGVNAEQWYYKKGFVKIAERKSRKGTLMFDLEKKIKIKNIFDYK